MSFFALATLLAIPSGVRAAPGANRASRSTPPKPPDDDAGAQAKKPRAAAATAPPAKHAATQPAARKPASAGSPVAWQPHWPRVHIWEYIVPVTALGLVTYIDYGVYRSKTPKWTGPILFDKSFRSLFRFSSPSARVAAATASDVTWGATWAVSISDELIPLLYGDLDTTWQMFWIDAQVMSIIGVLSRLFPFLVRRERPQVASCATDHSSLCDSRNPTASFWSGHTAMAAASAGLTCVHHQFLSLYRNRIADAAACATTIAASLVVASLRMAADLHYASDTLLAGTVGFLLGYFYPRLLHFRYPRAAAGGDRRPRWKGIILPMFTQQSIGVSVGIFGW